MTNDFERDGIPAAVKPGKPDGKRLRETAKRLRQGKEANLRNRASIDWRLDQARVSAQGGHDADIMPLAELKQILMQSRTAAAIFDGLADTGLDIVYDTQIPHAQFYPRGAAALITLNPHRPKGDLINMAARELRRAWQHKCGALVNPLAFEPDEAILVNRAQSADVLMISIKIAWELKLAGEALAWDYLVGSPMADVSRMFEVKARDDFRTLNNGAAARAAYDKFFEDGRTKMYDKRIIHQMLLDENGYIKSRRQRPRVSMDLFHKLGELPHGRNYLSMPSERTPTDMCYATVEDRSNANFLWFIKFERSFQEKELQMIEDSVKMSAEVVEFARFARKAGEEPQPRAPR